MGANDQVLADYAWADTSRNPNLEALSITLVEPVSEEHLAKLDPRIEIAGPLTVAQALDASLEVADFAWGSVLVQTDTIAGWTVFIEPNGWVTAMSRMLAKLSSNGRSVNVFWNVNANMSFGVARAGAMVREFDPLLYDLDEAPLPEEQSLPFGQPGRVRAASLALLTLLTGIRIEPAWILDRPRPTFIVPIPAE